MDIIFISLQACEIHFDNTPIPVENVLGKVGGGFKVFFAIPYLFYQNFKGIKTLVVPGDRKFPLEC